jgi:hypothetical protein
MPSVRLEIRQHSYPLDLGRCILAACLPLSTLWWLSNLWCVPSWSATNKHSHIYSSRQGRSLITATTEMQSASLSDGREKALIRENS